MMLEMVSDEGSQGRGFVAYFSGTRPYVDGTWSYLTLMIHMFLSIKMQICSHEFSVRNKLQTDSQMMSQKLKTET